MLFTCYIKHHMLWHVLCCHAQRERSHRLAHKLVRSFSHKLSSAPADTNRSHEQKAVQILNLAKIKHRILQVRSGWRKKHS